MKDIPDINCSYSEGSFDKDVGYCATEVTIRQSGTSLTLDTVYRENEVATQRLSASGAITRVYEQERLVQIKLDDGRRTYFDPDARRLCDNAEFISGRFETENFDPEDRNQLARLIESLTLVAGAIEPSFELNFQERSDLVWGEYDYPLAAYGSMQRMRQAVVGDAAGFRCRMTLTEEPDANSAYSFVRLKLEAEGFTRRIERDSYH